jgi:hypothetical protein
VTSPSQSIVGIVGTAEGITTLQDEVPKAFFKKKEALEALKPPTGKEPGSLHFAVLGVHDQTEDVIVLVKAKSNSESDMQSAVNALLDAESVTGYKPKVFIATQLGTETSATPVNPAGPTDPANPANPVVPTDPANPVDDRPMAGNTQPSASRARTITSRNRGEE